MNIIITSDNLRRSLSLNLRGWRLPVIALALAAGIVIAINRAALSLAEGWVRESDPRIDAMVDRRLQAVTEEREELWASSVDRLDQELTDLRVRLWRLGALGNEIADRLGLGDEIKLQIGDRPESPGPVDEAAESAEEQISLLETRLIETSARAESEILRLNRIGASTSAVAIQRATVPMRYPIEGRYWLTSGFGTRKDPFTGRKAFHGGYDYAARKGTPVLAGADGIVTFRGRLGRCGKMVEIYHGGDISTLYCHLSDYRSEVGDLVSRGDVVGLVGSTGRSTGPHLHYEVRREDKSRPYTNLIKELLEERPLVARAPPEDLHL